MPFTILIQIFFAIIIVGVVYSLWKTTKVYGGLLGSAFKWIGIGMIFFSLEALDRVLGNYSFVNSLANGNTEVWHNALLLLGLLFSAIGFSRLSRIAK
jgi:hypothetical protein